MVKPILWDDTPHPANWAFFHEDTPRLYHDKAGNYLAGLGSLLGAHRCFGTREDNLVEDHKFIDDKCTVCSIRRKPC